MANTDDISSESESTEAEIQGLYQSVHELLVRLQEIRRRLIWWFCWLVVLSQIVAQKLAGDGGSNRLGIVLDIFILAILTWPSLYVALPLLKQDKFLKQYKFLNRFKSFGWPVTTPISKRRYIAEFLVIFAMSIGAGILIVGLEPHDIEVLRQWLMTEAPRS